MLSLCIIRGNRAAPLSSAAGMAELVDAPDSKSGPREGVWVRFPLPAPFAAEKGITMKILVAADGSKYTRAAIKYLTDHLDMFGQAPEVHLLHVRPPLPGRA